MGMLRWIMTKTLFRSISLKSKDFRHTAGGQKQRREGKRTTNDVLPALSSIVMRRLFDDKKELNPREGENTMQSTDHSRVFEKENIYLFVKFVFLACSRWLSTIPHCPVPLTYGHNTFPVKKKKKCTVSERTI